jgi:imidazolonepropionase-like amidohydrolase
VIGADQRGATHLFKGIEQLADPDGLYSSPEAAYVSHPMQTGIWNFIATQLYASIPAPARTRIRDDFEQFQRPLTKVFHDHGGQLMTGTDALMPRMVAGFALHQELRELVDVGLTPYQALRTSTTIPYEYLGEAADAGTIQVGKRTDLLLVDGNPLQDIGAAARISGVLMRGRWIHEAQIAARMEQVRAAAPEAPVAD